MNRIKKQGRARIVRIERCWQPCYKLPHKSEETNKKWTTVGEHVTFARKRSAKTHFSVWYVEWSARSPDLSLLVFQLWGHSKEGVYQAYSQTVTELKKAIGKETRCIGSEVTKAGIGSMKKSAQHFIQSRGRHLDNYVFSKIRLCNLESLTFVLSPVFIYHPV